MHILRPQEIPIYVAEGLFDLGVTGRDWVEETGADVVSLGELQYSKVTTEPVKVVLAVSGDSPVQKVEDLPQGCRVSTEYPALTKRFLAERGVKPRSVSPLGLPRRRSLTSPTRSSRSPRQAGHFGLPASRVIDTLLLSYTELIANPVSVADPEKLRAMGQLLVLLQGALEARGKVLVKLNVAPIDLPSIIAVLPSMRSPTVSKLFGEAGYAVEAVVPKSEINILIPALKERGATDIIELPIAKIVH